MASITTRAGKGSALTNAEVDANFTNLNTELGQKLVSSDLNPYLLSATAAATYLALAGGSLTGNLNFSGAGLRITGDFSTNTNQATRLAFQSSTTNGNSVVAVMPNGSSTTARWVAFNNSDPTNCGALQLSALVTDMRITSNINGSGTLLPMTFYIAQTEAARFDTSGQLLAGSGVTGAWQIPAGTTGQRPGTPANGMLRYNSTTTQFEGYANNAWGAIAGGGGSTAIAETAATISTNYSIAAGNNGFSVGPVTIASGASVTVPSGRSWLIASATPTSGNIATNGKAVAMAIVFGA